MAKAKAPVTVKFTYVRETKNKDVYSELDAKGNPVEDRHDQKIGTLYVSKDTFDGTPKRITASFLVDD